MADRYKINPFSGTLDNTGSQDEVTAAAAITDNAVVRGDGGASGIQKSGILIDDSDLMTVPSTAGAGILLPTENDATTPTLAIGDDGDSGDYESVDDTLNRVVGTSIIQTWKKTTAGNNSLQHDFNGQAGQATGDEIIYDFSYTVNKATSGDTYGIYSNATITNGPGAEYLLWLAVDGSEKMYVTATGSIFSANALIATSSVRSPVDNNTLLIQDRSYTSADNAVEMVDGTVSNTSGEFNSVLINTTINQASGTANNNIIKVNPTLTAEGSGGTNLAWFGYGGTAKVTVDKNGIIGFSETTTPSSPVASYGYLYTKSDNELYFTDGAGAEKVVQTASAALNTFKDYSFSSPSGGSGVYYVGGFYKYSAADANLNQGSTTVNLGTANIAYGAHAFLVAGAAGTASGGSGAVIITVTGTSITDAGARSAADSETIVSDITAMSTDEYFETTKKWIGQVTYTLDVGATGHTAYAADFNYGFVKYEDMGNIDFTVTQFEITGRAGANDASFNVKLYKHTSSGWTYDAAAFVPTPTTIVALQTDYNTEYQLANGEAFAYKRTGLSTAVTGSGSEGVIIEITTGANNAVENANIHLGATF